MIANFQITRKLPDGKTEKFYTNSTWVEEGARNQITQLINRRSYVSNGAAFFTGYGLLEAVNRIKFFNKYPLLHRIGIVLVPTLVVKFAAGYLYARSTTTQITKLLGKGVTPAWKNKNRVPELDKVFFELDDDKNFQPNILHHGLNLSHIDGFYPDTVIASDEKQLKSFIKGNSQNKHDSHHDHNHHNAH